MMRLLRPVAFACLAACAASDRSYVHFDQGIRRPRTVSMVGVFRDGTLDPRAWDAVGPPLAARLGGEACAPLFRSSRAPEGGDVGKRLDAYVRAHGVPDELLDGFASLADGDAIVLVSVTTPHFDVPPAGSAAQAGGPGGGRSAPPGGGMGGPPGGGMGGPPGGGMGGPPGGGGGGPGGPPPTPAAPPPPPLEISATVFSLATHRVTGTVAISATAEEHVFSVFANRLATELDGARCRRWAKTNLELLPTEAMPP